MQRKHNDSRFSFLGRFFGTAPKNRPSRFKAPVIPAASIEGEQWDVWILDNAKNGANKQLDDIQFAHVIELCKRLKDYRNPYKTVDLDIVPVPDRHVELNLLRDKGGPLRGKEIQIAFGVIRRAKKREIIVLQIYSGWWEEKIPAFEKAALVDLFREYLHVKVDHGKRLKVLPPQ